MGQERWRMQLGGDDIVCEGDNNTTMREAKKAWMGGDDVVCEGDDNTCAFLHCTTKDLTIWLILGGYEQPNHTRDGYQSGSKYS